MTSTQAYHDNEFLHEVWGLFGVGFFIILVRFIVRLRTVGLRQFDGDDYISIFVLACYTADAVTVTLTYFYGSNVDYTPEQLAQFTHQQHAQIVFGSKMQLFAWFTYTSLVWSLKACMLFFFNRLTFGLDQQTLVRALGIACAVTYVAVFLTIACSCHPIQLNWQTTPYPPVQCTLRAQNMYVSTILNVVTDGAMLAIPLPLLWKLQVPLRRKITLAAMLSSGVFVITAAIVRIVMTLKAHPSALTINRWGVRETIAGIIAVNMPILRPIFSKAFWNGGPSPISPPCAVSNGPPSRGARLASSFRKPDAFEIIDNNGIDPSKAHPGTTIAMRAVDGAGSDSSNSFHGDNSSEDYIIQHNTAQGSDRQGGAVEVDGADIEAGRVEITVQTSYAVSPAHTMRSSTPPPRPMVGRAQGWQHEGRYWDPMTGVGRGFGNRVTVGVERKGRRPG